MDQLPYLFPRETGSGDQIRDTAFNGAGKRRLNRWESMLDTGALPPALASARVGDIGLDTVHLCVPQPAAAQA